MTLSGLDIVCIGAADWHTDLLTNQQHLLRRAAERNRILFVESLGLRRPQLAARDVRRMGRRMRHGLRTPLREVDGLHVLSPVIVPLHTNRAVRAVNAELLVRYVSWGVRKVGLRRPLLWSFVPQAEVLLDRLETSQVLYYTDDDYPAKAGIDADSFLAAERRFAPRADVILASAPELFSRMRALGGNVLYAPNVADTRLFARALEPGQIDVELARLPEPRIVFVGAILAAKIDLALVVALARLRPSWSFVFVGPIGPGDPRTNVDSLKDVPNIHLLGHRPYEQLPAVLRGADATIVPYLLDGEMRSVFPMKTYEYLAAGRAVVSTPLETLADVPEVIKAATAGEFAARLQEAIENDSDSLRVERSRAAQSHSWESRLDQIACALEARAGGRAPADGRQRAGGRPLADGGQS